MEALDTLFPDVGTKAACEALGISRASLYRHKRKNHVAAVEPEKRSAPPRALGPEEKRQVLEFMNSERFMDKAPQEIHATLLDEGVYLCSTRTMYRILAEHGEPRNEETSSVTRLTKNQSSWPRHRTRCGPGISPSSWGR